MFLRQKQPAPDPPGRDSIAETCKYSTVQYVSSNGSNILSCPEQLTYLNLGGNQLAAIPDCLVALTNLQTLHLFKNKITSLPNNLPS